MAEESLWMTAAFSQDPLHPRSQETIQEIRKTWKTITSTKAALRHIETKLDVGSRSTAVSDTVMDTRKPASSATRKISRKDGRYLEDSHAHRRKSARSSKSTTEKPSRSPLRATTLESNVKASYHVGFREPLASYCDPLSALSSNERGSVHPVPGKEEKDFESTRSSAVDETTVRYLNDRLAIDALEWKLALSSRDMHADFREMRASETSRQPASISPSSNRLDTLKRRQPDAKLEKLKERIRRQWELSGDRDSREKLSKPSDVTDPTTSTKTRKVAAAPPAPSYRGFNPPETKIRTPDGKVFQDSDFQSLSAHLQATVLPSFHEETSKNDQSQVKRTSRPVRKVQRLGGAGNSASPDGKIGHIISTSSWRDGQKLVKQLLGPAPKTESESKSQSIVHPSSKGTSANNGHKNKRSQSKERISDRRATSSEQQRDPCSKPSSRHAGKQEPAKETARDNQDRSIKSANSSRSESHNLKSSKGTNIINCKDTKLQCADDEKHKNGSAELKKDFLPLEIRGILDDLQLESGVDGSQRAPNCPSSAKRKSEKGQVPEDPHMSSKRRHYDTEQVRLYITRQQEERKKRQNEQREAQRQAEEQKNKRLQELYQKQREAFSKAKNGAALPRAKEVQESTPKKSSEPNLHQLQDTYTKVLLGQAWADTTTQEKQPLYQPSGESDKENKGQERPPSASSSSDLSLSEPIPPLLRSDLEAYYPQQDRLTSKGPLPLSQFLALPKDLDSLLKNSVNAFPMTQKMSFQGKPSADFKSNLDRIESLKATAVSLSTRIENEAKKLAGGSLNFPLAWSSDPDPKPPVKTAWKKPDSPPEREIREDVFSNRIQKMLSTCATHFSKDDLPGSNHLYRKLPEESLPHNSTSFGRSEFGEEERSSVQRFEKSMRPSESPNKEARSPNSSTSSISEGPILSDGSISEGEGRSRHETAFRPADTLKSKELCIKDNKSFAPLSEFKREAEKYPPLLASNLRPDVKGPWEELSKGSPHSVINIFTRSYQLYGNELNGRSEESAPGFRPLYSAASSQNNISYADDFISTSSDSQRAGPQSMDSHVSSSKEELPLAKCRSDSHSSHAPSAASSPLSASSQSGSLKQKTRQNDGSPFSGNFEQNLMSSEHKGKGAKQSAAVLTSGKEQLSGSESDSTLGDISSRSTTSFLSDSGKDIKNNSIKDPGPQVSNPPAPTPAVTGSQAPGVISGPGQSIMRFSPAGLQQRLSAELNYLGAMEESVRQICDVERVRGISLAQQETVSLAQILKSQQQRHEQNMAALRQQAEQEAQASKRQLEEARQIAAQTQAEMLQRFQKTIEASTSQTVNRVQEELDREYLSPTSSDPASNSLSNHQKRHRSHGIRKRGSRSASPSSQSPSNASSIKERLHSSSSEQDSQSASSIKEETMSNREQEESIFEELQTPDQSSVKGDSSISIDDKGASSAGPVKKEGIEEVSFRSLLPSEAHRRDSLERQRSQRHESDEESTPEKELSGPFSSGQDSFWKFTMEMVRQYMQEGEMRSTHQAALLRLRQKALKDKTKAELAWLEHQKRRLRDKGEDDKMPPLRKRQRGLLLRLQQEQAEIKRLQEANKAARRERQLILKQQEEIQRIQNSTLRLQEKLKSAESGHQDQTSEVDVKTSPPSSHVPSEAESRSPSPVSVSGSETSSIMQKLRKMHSHMDAKFLTKREQQLVQRRLHAQELLEWKRRLDAEELEIRRIEKQALAAWDNQRVKTTSQSTEGEDTIVEEKRSREGSPTPGSPTIRTRTSLSVASEYSEKIEPSSIAEQIQEQSREQSSIAEDLVISTPSKMSLPRSSKSPVDLDSSKQSIKSGRQKVHITLRPHQLSHTWSEESLSMTHSEATSDQSDIEGRIWALKEELRKRKSVVDNLKREQKRRQKERLRAQEAILLQQLQSYDEYIQKTQAELSGEQGTAPIVNKSLSKSVTPIGELVKPDTLERSEVTPSPKAHSEHATETSLQSEAEISTQEKSLTSKREVVSESFHERPAHSPAPFSARDNIPSAIPQSPPFKEQLPCSTFDSPASSIQSDIPEDVLETQSHRSISPLPVLQLHLKSETPEPVASPQRDHSYSDDFEASAAYKHSASETPCDELDGSYMTTPGRDIPSESFDQQDDKEAGLKSGSLDIQGLSEIKSPLQEPQPASDPFFGLQLGDRVLVSGVQPGTLRFKGETLFAEGEWAGVELDKSEGNNDGSLGGNRYFVCSPLHGIFAPPHKISRLSDELWSPAEDYIFNVDTSLVQKDHSEHVLYIEDLEPKSPRKRSPLESTESSVSEAHSTSLEEELQVDLPTDATIPAEKSERPQTPLLELTEKPQDVGLNKTDVTALSESLLESCLKDTVIYLQNIRQERAQKIQQSNQELLSIATPSDPSKKAEEVPRQEKPQWLEPGLKALDKDVTDFEPGSCLLSVLGEEPDWFDEDFGLSSRKNQQLERAPSAGLKIEPKVSPLPEPAPKPMQPVSPPEVIMAVPHTVPEVEQLVEVALDKLWEWKQMDLDLQEIRNAFTCNENEEQSPAYSAYKEMVFDLTLHIFDEICSVDPRGSQPPWKKPIRVSPSYSRRVRDHNNTQEVKAFLTSEVLNLLSLRKEHNQKTDWQRMMKFGRKKRDRVDHILVQELHEEEAQWVNYDEDELFVKMQLADGIFESLIRDTIQVLQSIQNKKNLSLLV